MTPLQEGRVNAALNRAIRYDGRVWTRRTLVEHLIKDKGWRVSVVRGQRRLIASDGSFLDEKSGLGKIAMWHAEAVSSAAGEHGK